MTCKFWKSALTDWPWFAATAWLLAAPVVHAQQQPAASPSPTPAQAYVRLWNMVPGKKVPVLQLLYAENKVLATAASSNYGASYATILPGTYTFIIQRTDDSNNPLKKQAVVLRGDTYITFLVTQQNGAAPTVELIDDTLDPKGADGPAKLLVRQFMPEAQVTVATKAGAATRAIGYGDTAVLEGIPNQITLVMTRATGLGPEPKIWNTEADFTIARHATLLVVADPYGRFRPRLSYDGWNGALPTPKPSPTP